SIGGVWYTGTDFPAMYNSTYFHADYGAQWIKNFVFDQNQNLLAVRDFLSNGGGIVFVGTHPLDGALYYIVFGSTVKKISYVSTGNLPPTALASFDVNYG